MEGYLNYVLFRMMCPPPWVIAVGTSFCNLPNRTWANGDFRATSSARARGTRPERIPCARRLTKASENRWLRRRVEALEDRRAADIVENDGPPSSQRIEDLERGLEELLLRQQQIVKAIGQVQGWADRADGELDDLALVYREELIFGIGEPKWKRRPKEAGGYVPESRSLGPGPS